VMDFGRLWAQQGFVTAKGKPIKNGQLVADLLDAMLLPKELAVVKVKAHTHLNTPEARGNALADDASRKAARQKEGRRNGNIEMETDLGMENDYAKCKIHKPQRVPLEAKYEGPYQILLVTPSAIRVANKTKCIHASHCKLVDAPTD